MCNGLRTMGQSAIGDFKSIQFNAFETTTCSRNATLTNILQFILRESQIQENCNVRIDVVQYLVDIRGKHGIWGVEIVSQRFSTGLIQSYFSD